MSDSWRQFLLSSTVNQRHIFMYAPPVGPPSHSGHHSEPSRVPCATQEVLPSCLFHPWMATVRMRQSQFLPQPLLPWYLLSTYFFWWPTFACSPKGKRILGNKAPAQLNKHGTTSQYSKVKSQLSQSSCRSGFGFPSLSRQDNQKHSRNPDHFVMCYLIRCFLEVCPSYLPKV